MNDESDRDDINIEPDQDFGDIDAASTKIASLRKELKEALSKRDEYLAGWQRCKADSLNTRKEIMLQSERAAQREKEQVAQDLIPVLDSFDMASATEAWESVSNEWRSGVKHIQNQLIEVLQRYGVERFGKAGDTFDPHLHEVVQEIEDGDSESGLILKVLRFGYKMGARVIRPAHIIVRK
jgi:molecular chaperone GrpE